MNKKDLITILYECVRTCNECADACLTEPNNMSECIRLDRVCASTCTALAEVLSTEFKEISGLINFCFFVCQQCEKECSQNSMEHCKKCAEQCRKCAKACQEYLQESMISQQ
ncbi:four-helix bundle copper-binding protein [Galbibacter sp. BG1]|uniref:four-helix bundle copper-binding protein n=1 Tax=Galbibacter sp. BG1 TaxID=1170699 RepID=UPI0015C160D2|nr:four-helix bundle copper-binding protein [Galbibacter sp. BG1]QLE02128.1 four-helix bundle copper-binding protein [Galbibacter sp. BG1]